MTRGRCPVRPARPDDLERLRALTYASKAHWGYDGDRVRAWVDGLDLTHVRGRFVAEGADGAILGWAGVVAGDLCRGDPWVLDDLWVDPAATGRGVGASLFLHAADAARMQGASRLEWEAEPNAVGFYEKLGGAYVRESTSAWGRTLRWMGIDL